MGHVSVRTTRHRQTRKLMGTTTNYYVFRCPFVVPRQTPRWHQTLPLSVVPCGSLLSVRSEQSGLQGHVDVRNGSHQEYLFIYFSSLFTLLFMKNDILLFIQENWLASSDRTRGPVKKLLDKVLARSCNGNGRPGL